MSLLGLLLVALAYGIATGSISGAAGIFYFAPLVAVWPLISLCRGGDAPSPVQVAVLGLCGSAGAAAIAIGEYAATGTTRAGGSVANPIHFADAALAAGFLSLLGLVYQKGAARWLFILGPAAASLAVLLSGTRGAVLALVAMSLTAVVMAVFLRLVSLRVLATGTVFFLTIAVVGVIAGFGAASGTQRVISGLSEVLRTGVLIDGSTSLRLQMYEGGLRAFLASPVYGHGPFDYAEIAAGWASVPFESVPHLHNDLINFAASGGAFGITAYLLFLLAPVTQVLRSPLSSHRLGLITVVCTLVVGYLVMGLTNATFGILTLTVFYSAICLVSGMYSEQTGPLQPDGLP
jgi:O-antigen ligase